MVRLFTLLEQADGIALNGYEVEEVGYLHPQEGKPPTVARLTLFDEGDFGTDYHFLDQEVALQDDGTAGAITCAAPGCEPESEGVRLEFKATGPFHFLDAQQKAYVDKGGYACPFCGSVNLEGGHFEVDSRIAWQLVRCNGCGQSWNDQYTLTGFSPVED